MNIAVDCPECCECPWPDLWVAVRSASAAACGVAPICDGVAAARYKRVDASLVVDEENCGTPVFECGPSSYYYGPLSFGAGGSASVGYYTISRDGDGNCTTDYSHFNNVATGPCNFYSLIYSDPEPDSEIYDLLAARLSAGTYSGFFPGPAFAERTETWDSGVLSFVTGGQFKYRLEFTAPKVGNGKCYRVEIVERIVPALTRQTVAPYAVTGGGASLSGVRIVRRGCYRPLVLVGVRYEYDPESGEYVEIGNSGGGTGLLLMPVMATDGKVASLRILNPGSGYTSAPTVWFENQGEEATATATVTIDDDPDSPNYGRVIAATVTDPGDYLPRIAISFPSSSNPADRATVAAVMDAQGGLSAVNVTNAGARYYPTMAVISGLDGGAAPAVLSLHYGDETMRCFKWSGTGDTKSPDYEIPALTVPGAAMAEIVDVFCDCSDCPES